MDETKLKRLTLLLLEILILQDTNRISEGFAYLFNEFIYKCYREKNNLLELIFDKNMLKDFVDNNYEVLSFNHMYQLIRRYHEFDGYQNLLDSIGHEDDSKINELALQFISFEEEMVALYYADSRDYLPKGFPRILQ